MKSYNNNAASLPREICYREVSSPQNGMNVGNKIVFGNSTYNQGLITYSNGDFTLPKGKLYKVTLYLQEWNLNIAGAAGIGIYLDGTLIPNALNYAPNPAFNSNTTLSSSVINVPINLINSSTDKVLSVRVYYIYPTSGASVGIKYSSIAIEEVILT